MAIQKSKQILQTSGQLGPLFKKVQLLEELNTLVLPLLPEECRSHCRVANFDQNVLTLSVSKQQIVTPLRFVLPELLPVLRQHLVLQHLEQIKTKIMLDDAPTHLPPLTKPVLNEYQKTIFDRVKGLLKKY